MSPVLTLLLALASVPVDLGGARLEVPDGLTRLDDSLVRGSVALLPLVGAEAPRTLLALFAEPGEGGVLTLAVGRVEAPLELDARTRGNLASAIAGHFRAELGLEVRVERPVRVEGPAPRLEALAHTRVGDEGRAVRYAFVPAGEAHYVLVASSRESRLEEQEALVTAAFASFSPANPLVPRPVPWRPVLFGLVGVAVVVALRLLRRRG